ncbi:hypothetical protein [Streptomyces sp. NPDC002602]|uniref:hypothetical protein n=1 Tax=Streptomyces sp. NPDC002602 TaxID=3364654 RepID=UPI003687F07C
MNRATHTAAAAITAILLAGCSATSNTNPETAVGGGPAAQPAPAKATDATSTFKTISATVPAAKPGTTVTAENDANHMLGRPNGYTSKVTFTDGRIPANQTEGLEADDLARGGSIETFCTAAEAKARRDYLRAATSTMPALAEYDYLHGATLIRVSRLLTPAQAGDYEKAAAEVP